MLSNVETNSAIKASEIDFHPEVNVEVKTITGYIITELNENECERAYEIDDDYFSGKFFPQKQMQELEAKKRKINNSIKIEP